VLKSVTNLYRKFMIWILGSSYDNPSNWTIYYIIWIIIGLISKTLTCIVDIFMLDVTY